MSAVRICFSGLGEQRIENPRVGGSIPPLNKGVGNMANDAPMHHLPFSHLHQTWCKCSFQKESKFIAS